MLQKILTTSPPPQLSKQVPNFCRHQQQIGEMKGAHEAISKEFDRVKKKQKTTYDKTQEHLDKLITELSKCMDKLDEPSDSGLLGFFFFGRGELL